MKIRDPLLMLSLLTVASALTWSCRSLRVGDGDEERTALNFHVLEEGRAYRSAQPFLTDIKDVVEEYGVKTIINLRGAQPGEFEYEQEREIARALGVELENIGMSARRLPHEEDLKKLLRLFDEAEYPIWFHCQAGADRTGEAAAIYAMEHMGQSREEALEQLTPKFLHLESKRPAKRYFIREVYQGKEWAMTQYDPCAADYEFYDKSEHCQ